MDIGRVAMSDVSSEIYTNPTNGYLDVTLKNGGGNGVDVSDVAGTAFGNGFLLASGDIVTVKLAEGQSVHGICDATLTSSVGFIAQF